MSKEELKLQYKLKKISTKEYFLALGNILKSEIPVSKSPLKNELDKDLLAELDGKLPIFAYQSNKS